MFAYTVVLGNDQDALPEWRSLLQAIDPLQNRHLIWTEHDMVGIDFADYNTMLHFKLRFSEQVLVYRQWPAVNWNSLPLVRRSEIMALMHAPI